MREEIAHNAARVADVDQFDWVHYWWAPIAFALAGLVGLWKWLSNYHLRLELRESENRRDHADHRARIAEVKAATSTAEAECKARAADIQASIAAQHVDLWAEINKLREDHQESLRALGRIEGIVKRDT